MRRALLLALIAAGPVSVLAQAPAPAPPVRELVVSNWSFDPNDPADAAGRPPFDLVTAETLPSSLQSGGEWVEYLLVQAAGSMADLRSALDAAGAERLGEHPDDGILARVSDSLASALLAEPPSLPEAAVAVRYLPAYKPAPAFEEILALPAVPLDGLQDAEGFIRFRASWHRGEDPRDYGLEGFLPMHASTAVLDATVVADHPGSEAEPRLTAVAVPPGAAQAADAEGVLRALMGVEGIAVIQRWGDAELPIEWTLVQHQTASQPASPPPWELDSRAKLHARGVNGRGQVLGIVDRGYSWLYSEDAPCRFTYGRNASDLPPEIEAVAAPKALAPGDRGHRLRNKVVAAYWPAPELLGPLAPAVCQPSTGAHGAQSALLGAGDAFGVPGARAGASTDDPRDDEAASNLDLGVLLDHHQEGDGMAPGAQLVIQDFVAKRDSGCPTALWSFGAIAAQAYDTLPGVRVQNLSWGECECGGATGCEPCLDAEAQFYSSTMRTFDLESWRRRDYLPLFSAGNAGTFGSYSLLREAHVKTGLAIGGTDEGTDQLMQSAKGPGYAGRAGPSVMGRPGGRIKPDLVTTTTNMRSSKDWNGDSCTGLYISSGTSSAAPIASGLAALARQYFVDGYYPGGSPGSSAGFSPTNALLKAVLINSTRDLQGTNGGDVESPDPPFDENRPTHGQGWGRPVLDDTLFFAGDPTQPAASPGTPGERSFLLVLNDAPNGLEFPFFVNDGRGDMLESFQGCLRWPVGPGVIGEREHVYNVEIDRSEDFHLTLAWAAPPTSETAAGAGLTAPNPLLNDLDLELISPTGDVHRPQPGLNIRDGARLWMGGYTMMGDVACPPECDADMNATCPSAGDENEHAQNLSAPCDFAGRDEVNTVENVFLAGESGGSTETWQVRVLFYSHRGGGLTQQLAWPNLNDIDGSTEHDLIDDHVQGYALVASGNVATPAGVPFFGASRYSCGEPLEVFLRDSETSGTVTVDITTTAGDCDRVTLTQSAPDFLWASSQALTVEDPAEGGSPGICEDFSGSVPSDGVIFAPDDSLITVTYEDLAPVERVRNATTRVTCRDFALDAIELFPVEPLEPCRAHLLAPATLVKGGTAYLRLSFDNLVPDPPRSALDATGLTATLVPGDHAVDVAPGTVPMANAVSGGTVTATFPVLVREEACDANPAKLGFHVDIRGDIGFEDRAYFDLPVDCSTTGSDEFGPARPAEVPSSVGGAGPFVLASKENVRDIRLDWAEVAGADRYDIWRGNLFALTAGDHDHEVSDDEQTDQTCGIAPSGTGTMTQPILGEIIDHPGSHYYLVTASSTCQGGHSLNGSAGVSSLGLERPAGVNRAAGCQ